MGARLNKFGRRCIGIVIALGIADDVVARPIRDPLPIDVALSLHSHNDRSTFAFSPDGQWIAHTVKTGDVLFPESRFYSATGVPLAEGRARMEAHITNTRSGEEVRLGDASKSSWAPTWSPDSKQVAFYSDEGGSAGLWIWDVATRHAARFPGIIARPFFGFEAPRWAKDSHTLLCKVLPEGMTIAQANALAPLPEMQRHFPAHAADDPGVLVWQTRNGSAPDAGAAMPAFTNRSLADLALLDLQTRRFQRIVSSEKILWYGFSPDQRYVAYTRIQTDIPDKLTILYEIGLIDRGTGQRRTLASQVSMNGGIELNWSPDSRSLAIVARDDGNLVHLAILSIDGSPLHQLTQSPEIPIDEVAPHWDAEGRSLYVTTTDSYLWRVDATSGASVRITAPSGVGITSLVAKFDQPDAWTTDHGRHLWAIGQHQDRFSLLRIDAITGRAQAVFHPAGGLHGGPNIDANDTGRQIAWVAGDQRHTAELWTYDTIRHHARQVSHLNPELERHELGDARLISFHTADGRQLHASLLLPPGYQAGQALPTVVWVYGGENGSDAVHTFGLLGDAPVFNMHILATRGYAVLFPDAPLTGRGPVRDLLDTVMPAVDAAVAQGFADPARLAIMGQSFGAYSTLALISHTDRFKAAVITASVINPDLLASYLELDPDGSSPWSGYLQQPEILAGSPWQYRERYLANSPIYDFDKIKTPVLMAQGADDGRLFGSDATFAALRFLGKDVEYRIYEGEDHVLERKGSMRDFWVRRPDFLQTHLTTIVSSSTQVLKR